MEKKNVMNHSNRLNSKRFLTKVLSLGMMLLGIGSIYWALLHIHQQTVITANFAKDNNNSLTFFKKDGLMGVFPPFDLLKPYAPSNETGIFTPIHQERILYPVRPAMGDNIGSLFIPVLKQTLPIIEGANEDELKKGVGHFAQSVLPGENNNSVLSGHRDTVFRELGKLKIGDQLITRTSAGTFIYLISNTRIVHKDDKTVIVPTDHAVLTVTTCYPFRFIGDAPDRYIITADLVKSE